jgi:predicted ATPase/DNA-binding SARP family transcriptional activator
MSQLKIYLLGSPRVESNNIMIQMDTRKAFALLGYLAVTAEQHTRDTLATLLWPEYDQTRARAALRRTLSTLKRAVGDDHLEITRESITLQIDESVWIDSHQFEKLLGECKERAQAIDKTCIGRLEEAVALYRGDFMAGFTLRDSASFDDWQFFQADTFKRELASALHVLLQGYSESGEFEKAIDYGRQWLAIDPLREEAHRALMKNYEWAGQHTAALRQYRECVRILEQELGVPPLEETTKIYQSILENQLSPPAISSPDLTIKATPFLGETRPSERPGPSYSLVGRKNEWDLLLRDYAASSQDGHLCFIEGEVGVGKTRLAEEFLEHVRLQGAKIFEAHCYEGEANLAFGPIMAGFNTLISLSENTLLLQNAPEHWLSETARLVPEIYTLVPGTSPALPMDDPGAQARFFEGLRKILSYLLENESPGVFFLDDLQWADSASLEWLIYVSRRLKGTGLFILVTCRDDILLADHPLRQLFVETTRAGIAKHIQLKRLGESDVAELVNSTEGLSQELPKDFTQRLFQESEGLPLIAIEYLAGFVQREDQQQEVTWVTPGSVQDVLSARLAGVSETANQLLTTAAVIGRSFDFYTLHEVSGRSEGETISGLEGLLGRGLILERAEGERNSEVIYDFTHEKLRELAYEQASLTRRRLLHLRVAEVLSKKMRGRRDQGQLASFIANHYELAGQMGTAAEYFKQAGEHARSLYANQEAISFFQTALANGYPDASALYESIGDLQIYQGEYPASISSYETAAALCRPDCLSRLEHKLGNAHHRRGDWEMAEQHYRFALDELGEDDNLAERSSIYADLSRNAYQRGDAEKALDMAHSALELAETSSDLTALAQAHNTLGILARGVDDYEQAILQLTQSLEIADDLKELDSRIAALNNLALVYRDAGEIDQAIAHSQTALELCRQQGDRHREAALLNNQADLLHASGREDEAMDFLREAVVIFAEIGVEEGSMKPEIWKLVEW